MKIAVLIQCHRKPEQINSLLDRLNDPRLDCFIHVDKKQNFADELLKRENVVVLPDEKRVSVEWAQISQVTATLNLLEAAGGGYDYYWLISGQDWPLVTTDEIVRFFSENGNQNYVQFWNSENHGTCRRNALEKRNDLYYPLEIIGRKTWQKVIKRLYIEITGGKKKTWKVFERRKPDFAFFFGSSWWALTKDTVDWIRSYLMNHPDYYEFYKHTVCPDESFFQTLVMMSPYADERTDFLTYVRFSKGANSPDILKKEDYKEAKDSKYLVMRKVDISVDDFFKTV